MLFNLHDDPQERATSPACPTVADVERDLRERLLADWDPDAIDRRIRESQQRRLFLREVAMKTGAFPPWNYEARPGDAQRFVRPATATGAVGAKPRMRLPYITPTPADRAPKS